MLSLESEDKEILKEILRKLEKVKLCFPDYKKKFTMQCDASDKGIGSVLYQENKIIGYYSRKFQGSELNYTVVEKEFFAILLSLLHFRNIIQGCFVEIHTDNNNCTYDPKKLSSRVMRWHLLLSQFDYKITHIQGSNNLIADKLSRCLYASEINQKERYDQLLKKSCRYTLDGKFKLDNNRRVIIKNKEIKEFLIQVHEICGHRGISTLYNNLKNNIYIYKLRSTIQRIIGKCKKCKLYKLQYNYKNTKLKIKSEGIFQRISTDVYGPFSLENFKTKEIGETGYILSLTDIYSRTTKLYFKQKVDTTFIIDSLQRWIKEFEPPKFLISDIGSQYTSSKFSSYLKELDIKHILIPPYTPSSNGISERLNKTISYILSISKEEDINKVVGDIETSININYNRSIGTSPYNICHKTDFFDIKRDFNEFKPKVQIEEELVQSKYRIGDLVYKRILNAKKLGRKYSKRKRIVKIGKNKLWVKLAGENTYTHIKNLKR